MIRQQKQIRLVSMRMQVQSLALLSGSRIQCCRELWCRLQMWPGSVLLWPWRRPAAVALIGPLAWEPPYAMGVAVKCKKGGGAKRRA